MDERNIWKVLWVLTLLVVLLILLPLVIIVATPNTASFDRRNVYSTDGYKPAGYYIIRRDAGQDGFINITHPEGSNEFYIETDNIQNVTLNLETMYGNRNYLFGWIDITWLDAVKSVNNIVIYTNSTDGIDEFTFTEYPEVWFRVTVDDVEMYDWTKLNSTDRTEPGLSSGSHVVVLELMRAPITLYDALIALLQISMVLAMMYGVLKIVISTFEVTPGGKK